MAFINNNTIFNIDELPNPIIGIAATVTQHDSGIHQHQKNQLLYAPRGCMRISLNNQVCILPPSRAAWIPANVLHRATMTNIVDYRSVYFYNTEEYQLPGGVKIIEVTDLLKALIERMALWPWDKKEEEQTNTAALFFEELRAAKEETLQLRFPTDKRVNAFLHQLSSPGALAPPLNQLQKQIGASSKTISRIFSKETGMSYQHWRQQWRLLKAIELLSTGLQVNDVAYQLDFSSDSAFIHFFRQQTGKSPMQYL